jgi:hypothetical protein
LKRGVCAAFPDFSSPLICAPMNEDRPPICNAWRAEQARPLGTLCLFLGRRHSCSGRLIKDRDALLAFYDFPAEHWKHLRTTNVIESSFARVRHRTVRSKGCLSNKTALAMIFKLAEAAEKSWRRLDGHNQLPKVILGVKFTDGIEVVKWTSIASVRRF